jgi:hypothetical protein
MTRLQITLSQAEADALARWATSELRDPRDQILFILRRELEHRRLLPPPDQHPGGQAAQEEAQ